MQTRADTYNSLIKVNNKQSTEPLSEIGKSTKISQYVIFVPWNYQSKQLPTDANKIKFYPTPRANRKLCNSVILCCFFKSNQGYTSSERNVYNQFFHRETGLSFSLPSKYTFNTFKGIHKHGYICSLKRIHYILSSIEKPDY